VNDERTTGVVHVVVPDAIDDPLRPSGGNEYDRRICSGLAAAGWQVWKHPIPDAWPRLGAAGSHAVARTMAELPDGAVALVDGLIGSASPDVLAAEGSRLSIVLLVHLPLGNDPATRAAEAASLAAARAVIATSTWTRDRLLTDYALPANVVHVAEPGVDPAQQAIGSPDGVELLCVGAVAPHKGHDLLLTALISLAETPWRCTCVGPLDTDRAFVERLRQRAEAAEVGDRLRLTGPLTGTALDSAYRSADVLVHATRGETYGMVVSEALARGLPVIAAAVGGLPDALGHAPDGTLPGLLVPPDDADALTAALRDWLTDGALRYRLRQAALARRCMLATWSTTTEQVARVLAATA
jgi:glycosyltransferase involved in cell wall biosynthesis